MRPSLLPDPAPSAQPFDPALAEFRTRVCSMERIVDLLHVSHAPERIASYREAMGRGERFPPISVVSVGGRLIVADGHKRLSAYRQLGRPDILVELWPWSRVVADQGRQIIDNARKNGRVISTLFTDPSASWRLLRTTLEHWWRVAHSLSRRLLDR